jgi:thiol-disulfide isomerase/thioredoxin
MLNRFALLAALAVALAIPPARADETPPLGGSVANFSRIDPPRPEPGESFKDGSGRELRLADFRGKVVLLNIWASWCGPCKAEMPSLDRLQAKLGGADFVVLPVSIDRGGGPVVAFFYGQRDLSHLGVYLDANSGLANHLGIDGVPSSYLIDRGGHVVGELMGATEWDSPEALDLIGGYIKKAPESAPPRAIDVTPASIDGPAQRVGIGLSVL